MCPRIIPSTENQKQVPHLEIKQIFLIKTGQCAAQTHEKSIYCLTFLIITFIHGVRIHISYKQTSSLLKSVKIYSNERKSNSFFSTSNVENLDCNPSKIKSAFATVFCFDLLFRDTFVKLHEQFRHIYKIQNSTRLFRDEAKR